MPSRYGSWLPGPIHPPPQQAFRREVVGRREEEERKGKKRKERGKGIEAIISKKNPSKVNYVTFFLAEATHYIWPTFKR